MAALEEGEAEVHVEDVERFPGGKRDIGVQAAAPLAARHADVVVPDGAQRPAAEHDVAVGPSPQAAVLAERVVKPEAVGDVRGLVLVGRGVFDAQNFLQSDHIGSDFGQNLDHPLGTDTSVHPPGPVNVVGCDAHSRGSTSVGRRDAFVLHLQSACQDFRRRPA
jgi:hypothetical protein